MPNKPKKSQEGTGTPETAGEARGTEGVKRRTKKAARAAQTETPEAAEERRRAEFFRGLGTEVAEALPKYIPALDAALAGLADPESVGKTIGAHFAHYARAGSRMETLNMALPGELEQLGKVPAANVPGLRKAFETCGTEIFGAGPCRGVAYRAAIRAAKRGSPESAGAYAAIMALAARGEGRKSPYFTRLAVEAGGLAEKDPAAAENLAEEAVPNAEAGLIRSSQENLLAAMFGEKPGKGGRVTPESLLLAVRLAAAEPVSVGSANSVFERLGGKTRENIRKASGEDPAKEWSEAVRVRLATLHFASLEKTVSDQGLRKRAAFACCGRPERPGELASSLAKGFPDAGEGEKFVRLCLDTFPSGNPAEGMRYLFEALSDEVPAKFFMELVRGCGAPAAQIADDLRKYFYDAARKPGISAADAEKILPLLLETRSFDRTAAEKYLAGLASGKGDEYIAELSELSRKCVTDGKWDEWPKIPLDFVAEEPEGLEMLAALRKAYPIAPGLPSHVDHWETLIRSEDRSAHLAGLKLRPAYDIDVTGAGEWRERPEAPADREALRQAETPLALAEKALEKHKGDAAAELLRAAFPGLPEGPGAEILLASAAALPKRSEAQRRALGAALIAYRFAETGAEAYLNRTRDVSENSMRTELAKLKYRLSCLRDLFGDQASDAARKAVRAAGAQAPGAAPAAAAGTKPYNAKAFRASLEGIRKSDRLTEAQKAEKAAAVLASFGKIPGEGSDLLRDGADELFAAARERPAGKAGQDLAEILAGALAPELAAIDSEDAKIFSEKGVRASKSRLEGYVVKHRESSLARLPAGVCVAADLPLPGDAAEALDRENEYSPWDDPAYLQMVFRNPSNSRCEGLVMMHRYEDAGRKILFVSVNPSSTFVLNSEPRALFREILRAVTDFARDNGFGYVCASNDPGVRTNRDGEFLAEFEKAMAENPKIALTQNYQFSGNPEYWQCRIGQRGLKVPVLWKNPAAKP